MRRAAALEARRRRPLGDDLRSRLLFFFRAEDGIRHATVTGVQTCALPISPRAGDVASGPRHAPDAFGAPRARADAGDRMGAAEADLHEEPRRPRGASLLPAPGLSRCRP